jgi:ankyrin repeat protein
VSFVGNEETALSHLNFNAGRKYPLLKQRNSLVSLGCSLQWTPLGYALEKGNPEIVQMLLEHKANVEQTFVSILSLRKSLVSLGRSIAGRKYSLFEAKEQPRLTWMFDCST